MRRNQTLFSFAAICYRFNVSFPLPMICVLMLTLMFTPRAFAQTPAAEPMREIAVTAQARSWVPGELARITLSVRGDGSTAAEALSAIDDAARKVREALSKLNVKLRISKRGENFSSAAGKGAAISRGTAVIAERFLGVETSSLKSVGVVIDKALGAGAASVSSVEYFALGGEKQLLQAVNEATEKAKRKAQLVAQNLSVKLGPLIAATVTEEPQGAVLRRQMQQGIDSSRFSEKETNVYVNIRFEALSK